MNDTAPHPTRRAGRRLLGALGAAACAAVLAGCAGPPTPPPPPPPPPVARQMVVDGSNVEYAPGVSDDGMVVSFVSTSGDIVANPAIDPPEVYVLDRTSGVATALGRAPVAGQFGQATQVSGNGRYVVFTTTDGISPADTDGFLSDVYRYDRVSGTATLISTTPDLGIVQFNGFTASPDTSTVTFFESSTCAFGCPSANVTAGVWHDGSGASPAWPLEDAAGPTAYSPNGRYGLVRTSESLDPADVNANSDWYVHDFTTAAWTYFPAGLPATVSATVADDGDPVVYGLGYTFRLDRAAPSAPPVATPVAAWPENQVPVRFGDANGLHALVAKVDTPADPSTVGAPATCTWSVLDVTSGSLTTVHTATLPTGITAIGASAVCLTSYRSGVSANWRYVAYPTPFDVSSMLGPQDGIWLLDRSA